MCADENTSRRKSRKGPKKKEQNIEDMVKLMMEKGTDVPVFVAHDLSKLPPVTFNSMDVSTLLKNIKKTQDEVDIYMLKLCVNTQNDTFEKLRSVVSAVDTRVRDLECRGQSPQREIVSSSDKDLTHPKEIDPSPAYAAVVRRTAPAPPATDNSDSGKTPQHSTTDTEPKMTSDNSWQTVARISG